MSVFHFILASLAAYRIALMFAKEAGPGRIFRKLRNSTPPRSSLREGISCVFCESIWWSALITGYYIFLGLVSLQMAPIYWLSVSAVAVASNQLFTKGEL